MASIGSGGSTGRVEGKRAEIRDTLHDTNVLPHCTTLNGKI